MKLPGTIRLLGYAGLIPFFAGPCWLALAGAAAPDWVELLWLHYVAFVAVFLAGSFWGFALPAVQGPAGQAGILMASALMLATWLAMALPADLRLLALAAVFLLLLLADFWRERTLGTLPGYFSMRTVLTVGVLLAIGLRLAL